MHRGSDRPSFWAWCENKSGEYPFPAIGCDDFRANQESPSRECNVGEPVAPQTRRLRGRRHKPEALCSAVIENGWRKRAAGLGTIRHGVALRVPIGFGGPTIPSTLTTTNDRDATMDSSLNLNTLASSLPNSNLANAEKDLLNNFKGIDLL